MVSFRTRTLSLVAVMLSFACSAGALAQDASYQSLLDKRSSALVTVKFVLKVSGGGMMPGVSDEEFESEVTGVMIDSKGLVLCSDTQLGGVVKMLTKIVPMLAVAVTTTPTEIKVLIGDDTEGLDAEILVRDSELDLAWLRIKDAGDKKFDYLDLSKGSSVKVGDRVLCVRRMGSYFGRSPIVIEGRITGTTKKPRKLYAPSIELAMAYGLPIYTVDGKLAGITVTQAPGMEGAIGAFDPTAMLGQLSGVQEMLSGMILPAESVAKATKRALASLEEDEE